MLPRDDGSKQLREIGAFKLHAEFGALFARNILPGRGIGQTRYEAVEYLAGRGARKRQSHDALGRDARDDQLYEAGHERICLARAG